MNSQDEKIVLQQMIEYAYQMFRLIIYAIIATYFTGCFWFLIVSQIQDAYRPKKGPDRVQQEVSNPDMLFFPSAFGIDQDPIDMQVIKSAYFALNTLSTVGYGDFSCVNFIEMSIAIPIMLAGVAFFSYIMGNFI